MLGDIGHHVARSRGKGKVVGLGGARREGHVGRSRTDDGRHAGTGVLDGAAGPSRQGIGGRRVVEGLGKVGQHLGQDGRVDGSCRRVVQVGLAGRLAGHRTARRVAQRRRVLLRHLLLPS